MDILTKLKLLLGQVSDDIAARPPELTGQGFSVYNPAAQNNLVQDKDTEYLANAVKNYNGKNGDSWAIVAKNILKKNLMQWPPVTEKTKKQLTDDAIRLALDYGPMGLTIKTPYSTEWTKATVKLPQAIATPLSWFSDTGAAIGNKLWDSYGKLMEEYGRTGVIQTNNPFRKLSLQEALQHPNFFKNYPELKNLDVYLEPTLERSSYYSPRSNFLNHGVHLNLNPNGLRTSGNVLDTLLHEATHGVADYSKLPSIYRGTSASWIAKHLHLKQAEAEALKQLQKLKGYSAAQSGPVSSLISERIQGLEPGLKWGLHNPSYMQDLASELYRANPGEAFARLPYFMLKNKLEDPITGLIQMGYPVETLTNFYK